MRATNAVKSHETTGYFVPVAAYSATASLLRNPVELLQSL
jgi:hypothetical protein